MGPILCGLRDASGKMRRTGATDLSPDGVVDFPPDPLDPDATESQWRNASILVLF